MIVKQYEQLKKLIVARYSQEEIEDLIRKDLEAHGYISVLTDSKYVEDEWGMTTYLAVVTPNGLNE